MTRTLTLLLSFCLIAMMSVGCASLTKKDDPGVQDDDGGFFSRMPWSKKDKKPKPYPNPVKLATTWTSDTLTQSGRTPTRGFGARVFFYDERSRSVAVDGTLVVHGFDESEPDPSKATKRFEFTPEQFTEHYSQSELGASYSIWIPWDAIGGPQTRISLVATFRSKSGTTIQGTPTMVLLPGTKDNSAEALARRYSPEFRQWKQAAAGETSPSSGLTTTTIPRPAARVQPVDSLPPATSSTGATWNLARQSGTPAIDVVMRPSTTEDSPVQLTTQPRINDTQLQIKPASTRLPPL